MTSKTERAMSSLVTHQDLSRLAPLFMPRASVPMCFPGTRSSLIGELTEWGALPLDSTAPSVIWMFGPAGTGKSTIAATLANIFQSYGYLGSCIMFSRDVSERSQPFAMLRTMAHQLASQNAQMAEGIVAAIRQNSGIPESTLAFQFERLILEPATQMSRPCLPVVIIIDALDEGGAQDEFLSILAQGLHRLPKHIRVLITSRRDVNIAHHLSGLSCVREYDLALSAQVDEDIRTYISAQMKVVQQKNSQYLPPSWPEPHLIDRLVDHASGLFVWAAVASSYIGQFNPAGRITQIIENTTLRGHAEESLDHLFATAIGTSSWKFPDFATCMHNVLTVIIVARDPLSPQSIADLLYTDIMLVSRSIAELRSVLNVDELGLIRVVHPSVRDYLTHPNRCSPDTAWFINVEKGNCLLAQQCLALLCRELKFNSAHLNTAADLTPGKSKRSDVWIWPEYSAPSSIEYSSMAWVHHACSVNAPGLLPKLHKHIVEFYSSHFLHWLELLSLIRRSREAINALRKLHVWCLALKESELSQLVYDSWRFVNTFSQTIEAYPLLVYDTALSFSPKNLAVRSIINHQLFPVPDVLVGRFSAWDSCLYSRTMNSRKKTIHSFAISPKDNNIACYSQTVLIGLWNLETGADMLPPFASGHSMNITSLQFSPDSALLFSGSRDTTICSWDVKTGKLKGTFVDPDSPKFNMYELNGCRIYSIALFPERNLVAAARHDGTIALWTLDDFRKPALKLVGHTGSVCSIHANADQTMLTSGSEDTTVQLWDMRSLKSIRVYRGHTNTVICVVFSPDGLLIASGSSDSTIRVWSTIGGIEDCSVLRGHTSGVLALAFSPDGRYIASGGDDCQICVWTTRGNQLLQQFSSYAHPVSAIIFSDTTTLVSGSEGGEVRVWQISETETELEENTMQWVHKSRVSAVSISHSGRSFASACVDSTVIIWDAATGEPAFPPFKLHTAPVNCVAFSPDDTLVATGSKDTTVLIFDSTTGDLVGSPIQLGAEDFTVAFSEHPHELAIGTANGTVTVCDTRNLQQTLELSFTPRRRVRSIAFS
ncbi:WD40-repeat-containing domain protein, partial [Mycena polygramma]